MTHLANRVTGRFATVAVCAFLVAAIPAQAQTNLKNSPGVLSAFRSVVSRPSVSTVRVICDGADSALGTIIAADGWILTKGSELKGKVSCKLKDGRTFDARIMGLEDRHDLAMLKIEVTGLQPIEWRECKSATVGNWVASPGMDAEPVAIGVVSVAMRRPSRRDFPFVSPPPNGGYLGVGLEEGEGAPRIGMVAPKSAAEKAGLKVGDLVIAVAGLKVTTPERLVAAIQKLRPGASVVLQIKRGDVVKELKAILDKRPSGPFNRADFQNRMGSALSNRRSGFPMILQHDQVIKPTDCGGPLVDLDGKAVGINIARAGRTESYAIPTEAVIPLLADLRSGKLAPKAADPISPVAGLEQALQKVREELKKAEDTLKSLASDQPAVKEKKKTIESQIQSLRTRLAEAQSALDKARKDATKK